ncbi:unnamed protein product [Linum trigynum]|uniref:Uncharacterized protein n=1 Tax=Linum trigynum TaxID=586398 RepID=A0AAV2DBU5_9ROSI
MGGVSVLLVCTLLDARNLKKVGIRRTISKLCCRWPKKEFGKERLWRLVSVDWTMTGSTFSLLRFKRS